MNVSLCLGWRVGSGARTELLTSPLLPPGRHQLSLADSAGDYNTALVVARSGARLAMRDVSTSNHQSRKK